MFKNVVCAFYVVNSFNQLFVLKNNFNSGVTFYKNYTVIDGAYWYSRQTQFDSKTNSLKY